MGALQSLRSLQSLIQKKTVIILKVIAIENCYCAEPHITMFYIINIFILGSVNSSPDIQINITVKNRRMDNEII
jgi:hypothetical protein